MRAYVRENMNPTMVMLDLKVTIAGKNQEKYFSKYLDNLMIAPAGKPKEELEYT